jgi:hypothetical protein
MHHWCQSRLVEGSQDDDPEAFAATVTHRAVPESCQKLRLTSRHHAPRGNPRQPPLTCAVVWAREVLHFVVNHPSIDGKDGVASSIPPGGSTKPMTTANAGQFQVWDRWNGRR